MNTHFWKRLGDWGAMHATAILASEHALLHACMAHDGVRMAWHECVMRWQDDKRQSLCTDHDTYRNRTLALLHVVCMYVYTCMLGYHMHQMYIQLYTMA